MSTPHPITARTRLVQAALRLAADRIGEEDGDPNADAQAELLEDQLDDAARTYCIAADTHALGKPTTGLGTTIYQRAARRAELMVESVVLGAASDHERQLLVDLAREALVRRAVRDGEAG